MESIKIENAVLTEVKYKNDGKHLTLLFADENGDIYDVVFNQQKYDEATQKFEDNKAKADKVEENLQEYFGLSFSEMEQAVGIEKDVWVALTDNPYCALWEPNTQSGYKTYEKITPEIAKLVRKGYETTLDAWEDNGTAFAGDVLIEGKLYKVQNFYRTNGTTVSFNYSEYKEINGKFKPIKIGKKYLNAKREFEKTFNSGKGFVGSKVEITTKEAGSNHYLVAEFIYDGQLPEQAEGQLF